MRNCQCNSRCNCVCACYVICYVTVYIPNYVTVIRVLGSGTNEGSIPRSGRGRPPILVTTTLEDTDEYSDVANGHHVTSKQKGQVQIQICNNKGKKFIVILYNVLLAPDLCDRLFSIIMLMNVEHTFIFHKGFCTVYLGAEKNNAVTLPHSAQWKHAFTGKIKNMSKKINFRKERKLL